jgi:hypothetical protein
MAFCITSTSHSLSSHTLLCHITHLIIFGWQDMNKKKHIFEPGTSGSQVICYRWAHQNGKPRFHSPCIHITAHSTCTQRVPTFSLAVFFPSISDWLSHLETLTLEQTVKTYLYIYIKRSHVWHHLCGGQAHVFTKNIRKFLGNVPLITNIRNCKRKYPYCCIDH